MKTLQLTFFAIFFFLIAACDKKTTLIETENTLQSSNSQTNYLPFRETSSEDNDKPMILGKKL